MVNGEQDRIILFFKRASMWTLKTTDMPNPQIKQNKQTYDVLFGCPLTNGIRVQAFFAFEWFLTQLETSLSISHESRSKPLTCSTMLISKKFHVYLGAAPLKDLSSASVQWAGRRRRRRRWRRWRRRRWHKKVNTVNSIRYFSAQQSIWFGTTLPSCSSRIFCTQVFSKSRPGGTF